MPEHLIVRVPASSVMDVVAATALLSPEPTITELNRRREKLARDIEAAQQRHVSKSHSLEE